MYGFYGILFFSGFYTCKIRALLSFKGDFYMLKIFTDTSANLPIKTIRENNIGIVPFSYTINGVEFTQNQDRDFDGKEYYDSMREGAKVSTSMINSAVLTETFRESLENGYDILYIGMSGGISGTANFAALAAKELSEEFPERRIAAIDTLAASLGEGLQVLTAVDMLKKGADFDSIADRITESRHNMCQYFTVGDLEYLKRGGRIGKIATVIGSVLKIKPLLTGNEEGKIVLCGKARGKNKALTELAEKYSALANDKNLAVGIAHADAEDDAAFLESELRNRGFKGECITVQYEPVTGAHVGPGTVALFFYGIHK